MRTRAKILLLRRFRLKAEQTPGKMTANRKSKGLSDKEVDRPAGQECRHGRCAACQWMHEQETHARSEGQQEECDRGRNDAAYKRQAPGKTVAGGYFADFFSNDDGVGHNRWFSICG